MATERARGAWFGLALLAGCSSFPRPYTAAQLHEDSRDRAGAALVHYLGQTGADAGVCAPSSGVLAHFGDDDFETFLEGLDDGDVEPAVWLACARPLVAALPRASLAIAIARIAELFVDRADAADAAGIEVLEALAPVLDARPRDVRLSEDVGRRLRAAIAGGDVATAALPIARGLLEGMEIERGRFAGRPVTPERLRAIDDPAVLRRMALRLPTASGRAQARERIVDIALAASTSRWVREHADEVRERVLRTGRDGIDLSRMRIGQTRYVAPSPGGVVLVVQSTTAQTSSLLFQLPNETSVVPALDLRGKLELAVEGIDVPVTLCGDTELLDVTPCVDGRSLVARTTAVRIDGDGVVHFRDGLGRDEMLALIARGPELAMPISFGDLPLVELRWPMVVVQPPSIVFEHGESLDVRIQLVGGRVVAWYSEIGAPLRAVVVERAHVGAFTITTRGAQGAAGYAGSQGSSGSQGTMGMSASCPGMSGGNGGQGGPGGRGGDGGPGGQGGNGGNANVTVACSTDCDDAVALAHALVRSEPGPGGPGGAGGAGGSGGAGGQGGSGTSCYDSYTHRSSYVSGGSSGSRGSDGPRGNDGPPGLPGLPGTVEIRMVPLP